MTAALMSGSDLLRTLRAVQGCASASLPKAWRMLSLPFVAIALVAAEAAPADASVPPNMRGIWGKHGRCDVLADRLTLTREAAGWGKGPLRRVRYNGQSEAIFWNEEYAVDNFVIGRTTDILVHNTQGFHMSGEEGYARCTHQNKRMPWPPPIHARESDRFAYKFEMTPEEGPLNSAVQKRYTTAFDACQKRAVITQENVACFNDEFTRQDKTLNRVWRVVLTPIPPEGRGSLVAAQHQWVAKRDPFCMSWSDKFRGGTIAPVINANCRVEQTIRRTMWLERLR